MSRRQYTRAAEYFDRTQTRQLQVGGLRMGGQDKVLIQSMTNTKTKDAAATISQIKALLTAGCDLVRLAVLDEEDAEVLPQIVDAIEAPLVADIHFNYRLALKAADSGIAKIRINPGNIGGEDRVRQVVQACRSRGIPIRIGINSGSLEKSLIAKYGVPCPEAMIESAEGQVKLLEAMEFHDIALSFKSSDVPLTIASYRLASEIFPYPLHLGVTEAGTVKYSAVKSSAALGGLLYDGIGDTIRISVSDDPLEEIPVARQLLKAFNLVPDMPDLISCPTCGRIQYDMLPHLKEIEEYLVTAKKDITVAVMGCAVNGPQEASRADIGVAGGKNEALLFSRGEIIGKVPQDQLVAAVKKLIDECVPETA